MHLSSWLSHSAPLSGPCDSVFCDIVSDIAEWNQFGVYRRSAIQWLLRFIGLATKYCYIWNSITAIMVSNAWTVWMLTLSATIHHFWLNDGWVTTSKKWMENEFRCGLGLCSQTRLATIATHAMLFALWLPLLGCDMWCAVSAGVLSLCYACAVLCFAVPVLRCALRPRTLLLPTELPIQYNSDLRDAINCHSFGAVTQSAIVLAKIAILH